MPNEIRSITGSVAGAQAVSPSPKDEAPASSEAEHVLGVQWQLQQGNGCGTTSLAMALSHVLKKAVVQTDVDAEIRLTDIFTSASNMLDYAKKSHSIQGRMVNNLDEDEVVKNLKKGRPIIFLSDMTSTSRDIASMHYRVIDGYRREGKQLFLHIVDPQGWDYWRSWDELQPEWARIRAIGMETGYNRFGLILGSSPWDLFVGANRLDGVFAVERLVDAVSDTANDSARVRGGKTGRIFRVVWDALRALFAALLYPLQRLFGHVDRSDGRKPGAGGDVVHSMDLPSANAARPTVIHEFPAGTEFAGKTRWATNEPTPQARGLADVPMSKGTAGALTPP